MWRVISVIQNVLKFLQQSEMVLINQLTNKLILIQPSPVPNVPPLPFP